jgi:hypothetical protein
MSDPLNTQTDHTQTDRDPPESAPDASAAPGAAATAEHRIDAAASAALALAVTSARTAARQNKPSNLKYLAILRGLAKQTLFQNLLQNLSRKLSRIPPPGLARRGRRFAVPAAAGAFALLSGGAAVYAISDASSASVEAGRLRSEWAATYRQSRSEIERLNREIESLQAAVRSLSEGAEQARSRAAQEQSRVLDRLTRAEQGPQQHSRALAGLTNHIARLEAQNPAPKLAALGERLDRMENQLSSVVARAAKADAAPPAAPGTGEAAQPVQTGSVETKPARDSVVEGWLLHDVYGGVALIEGRNGRLTEVGPGDSVPGLGRVEAIERRGKRWTVVTAKGLIAAGR